MARQAQFSNAPIQVIDTPEMVARIRKIAEEDEVSITSVIRDCIRVGIDVREADRFCRPAP